MPATPPSKPQTRLLIAHRYLWPENLSLYPAMLKDIAEWHAGQGHEVTLLTSTTDGSIDRRDWANNHSLELIEAKLPSDRGRGAMARCLTLVVYLWRLAITLVSRRFDLVMISSYPPVAAAALVRWLCWLRGSRYVYHVQDHFPEMFEQKSGLLNKLVGKIAKRIDRRNVECAAAVITLSEAMRQTLLRRGTREANIQILQNFSVDSSSVPPADSSSETPTIVFAGNHGAIQNLPHFLRASKIASQRCEFRIRMIGWGGEAKRLEQIARDEAMTHVQFEGALPREEAQRQIASCDAGVVAAAPGLFDVAYPSKTTSYLTAGLPVLVFVEPDSPTAQEIEQDGLGVAASPTDLYSAADAIVSMVQRLSDGQFDRSRISLESTRLFSKQQYFQGYSRVVSPLCVSQEEPKMLNYTKDHVTFDKTKFGFVNLVLKAINDHLEDIGEQKLQRLGDIHRIPNIEQHLEAYRQRLFSLFRTPEFQAVYRAFGKSLIDQHFSQQAVLQKTPTVRIQLDGGKSVSYHSDAWYGHGEHVNSFWLPLTPVAGTNSLQIARDIDESRDFLQRIAIEQLDLDEINHQAAELCEPVQADFGDLILFNGDVVHGTLNNESGSSRVSFDFRIAHSMADIGTKPAANFFTYEQLSAPIESPTVKARDQKRRSAFMYSGICRGVSAKSQLVFLNEYARINNIDIVGSESEIVVFDYAPVLQKYAKNPDANMDCILLFSVDLLPSDRVLRERIYQGAIENRIAIVFGAEDLTLSGSEDIDRVESLLPNRPALLAAA